MEAHGAGAPQGERSKTSIPWLRVFIEGVVIVGSILLAFAIDASWDVRRELAEEHEILIGLEAEFEDLRERLDRWGARNRSGAELAAWFLSDSVSRMRHPEADSLLLIATMVNVLDQGGALDALLASGRLELIRDREMRQRLAKWPDWLEDIHTNDLSVRDFALQLLIPFLAERGIPSTPCPLGETLCTDDGPLPDSYLALSRDPEFRAFLIFVQNVKWLIAVDHENARDEADELLAMIRSGLSP